MTDNMLPNSINFSFVLCCHCLIIVFFKYNNYINSQIPKNMLFRKLVNPTFIYINKKVLLSVYYLKSCDFNVCIRSFVTDVIVPFCPSFRFSQENCETDFYDLFCLCYIKTVTIINFHLLSANKLTDVPKR